MPEKTAPSQGSRPPFDVRTVGVLGREEGSGSRDSGGPPSGPVHGGRGPSADRGGPGAALCPKPPQWPDGGAGRLTGGTDLLFSVALEHLGRRLRRRRATWRAPRSGEQPRSKADGAPRTIDADGRVSRCGSPWPRLAPIRLEFHAGRSPRLRSGARACSVSPRPAKPPSSAATGGSRGTI